MQLEFAVGLDQVLPEFAISAIAGAIGGFIGGINAATKNSISLMGISRPGTEASERFRQIDLGFLGDLLLGGAAGIAIIFFINIGVTNNPDPNKVDFLRLIPICLMAGVVSKRALAGMSETVIRNLVSKTDLLREEQVRLKDQVGKLDHVNELIQEGERHLQEGEKEGSDGGKRLAKYETARNLFLQAIEYDQDHAVAYVSLGRALKRLSGETSSREEQRNLLRLAIDANSEAIKLNPTYDRAYYNRACYKALIGATSEVVSDLEKAIQIFQLNRLYAKSDSDLDSVRSDSRFRSLIDGEGELGKTAHAAV